LKDVGVRFDRFLAGNRPVEAAEKKA